MKNASTAAAAAAVAAAAIYIIFLTTITAVAVATGCFVMEIVVSAVIVFTVSASSDFTL